MSEEEINKKIDYFNQHEINVSDEESEKILREAEKVINGIIYLYHELKDKNASLLKEIKLMKSININDNYISKDKINNKIKEYQNKLFQDVEENKVVEYENIIQVLEDLLEEE